jgi:hypothetical protein
MCHSSDIDEIEARQEQEQLGGSAMVAALGTLMDIRELLEMQLRLDLETARVASRSWKLDVEQRRNFQELLVRTKLRLQDIADYPEAQDDS